MAGGRATAIVPIEAMSCSLCTRQFKKDGPRTPCILSCCSHTFCRQCCVDWEKNKGSQFPCPTCREVCTVAAEKLHINFIMRDLVEEAERVSGQTNFVCQECNEENEATHHCTECSKLVCEECTRHHRKRKVSVHHTLQTIEEFTQSKQPIPKQIRTCKKHNKELDLYCVTCQMSICHYGIVKDHKGHEHEMLSDVAGMNQVCRTQYNHAHKHSETGVIRTLIMHTHAHAQ